MEIAAFLILLFIAEVLGTLGGFGSSMFLVPLIGYFFGFQQALLLTAGIHVISNFWKIVLFRKGINKKLIVVFGIPAVVAVVAGALLSNYISEFWANVLLGSFLISLSLFMLLKPNFALKPSNTNMVAGGGLSGFAAGLLGTGGAIRGMALAAYAIEKDVFIATSAIIDFGVDTSRFIVYLSTKELERQMLYYILPVILISFAGSYVGKLLLKRISNDLFKKIVLVLVLVTGVFTIVKYFWDK